MAYQRLIIQGNLGKDPETRYTADGKAVVNFSVAVSEKYNGNETTEWFNCVAFGKTAEIISEHFGKGGSILIEGRLKTEKWQDKEGNDRYTTKVMVDKFSFVGDSKGKGRDGDEPRQPRSQQEKEPKAAVKPAANPLDADDDIPF